MHLKDIKRRSEAGKNKRQRHSMMKFSVALIVLLHVCLSFSLKTNLYDELMTELEKLNTHYSALVSIVHWYLALIILVSTCNSCL